MATAFTPGPFYFLSSLAAEMSLRVPHIEKRIKEAEDPITLDTIATFLSPIRSCEFLSSEPGALLARFFVGRTGRKEHFAVIQL